ncbi:hypothetical protein, unknown function [Leishmania mexicana MHOM/GT/2001/U1103]|uniref:U-box domain-containing protein n=1 Tax=Leishmania mexicana (strain MHOM/GT/2001/U1103) TaxID=929439 RepID=E9AYD9_LEIMU|nr:hypothetical protein, unknown function [Leishmania mexicana MHOM/GT/2001/U1103]CBZ27980.1 hypothetical protein, unknown function [Leishmania mexicana MHOM/GT/2001/U1103]
MDALVESIVQSNARAELTAGQLQALIGLCTSTSEVLSPSHTLFRKLSATLAASPSLEDASQCIRLCILLCREVAHREIIFSLIEAHNVWVESIATPSISALGTSHAGHRSGTTYEATEDRSFLSQLILVMLASAESKMKASDLVDFLGADVESTVEVLVSCYGSVCGALPGVLAAASGGYQLHLVARLVDLFRELTFWITYEELHSSLRIGSKGKNTLSQCTGSASMRALSAPFRHHVGQLISYLVRYDFFGPMSMYLPLVFDKYLASPRSSSSDGDDRDVLMALSLLRSHLLLLQTLLTLTDQYALVLRKALCRCGLLSKVCGPLLRVLCRPQGCLPGELSLFVQTAAVASTLTYHSGECHQFWGENSSVLVAVADRSVFTLADGCIADPRTSAELVAQLVRLVVNSHSSAAVAPLLKTWESVLDSGGKQYVACSLSNPTSRSRPLDISSPSYNALRCVFRVDTTAPPPPPVAARRGRVDDLLRQRRRGPHNREQRSLSRGRSRSSARSKRCPRHQSRQARLQRYHLLVQSTTPTTAVAREQTQVQLDALDFASDSSSDESSDDRDEAADAYESTCGPQEDLSRWRRGPPPRTIPIQYICSLSHSLIRSTPVLSSTGYLFDEDVIIDYLQYYDVCPISGAPMSRADLVVDTALKEELGKVRANFM